MGGGDWSDIRVRLGRCERSLWPVGHARGQDWFRSRLVDFDFWFIWQGRGYLKPAGERPVLLQPGVCVWMKPGEVYDAWQADNETQLGVTFFHFTLEDAAGRQLQPDHLPPFPRACEILDFNYFNALTHRILRLHHTGYLPTDELRGLARDAAHALAKGMLVEYMAFSQLQQYQASRGIADKHLRDISQIATAIYENPGGLSHLDDIIHATGYSSDHFRRLFKQATGTTPHAMLIRARIERAKQLLRETETPVGQIAGILGYRNIYYFSKQFKDHTGVSPIAFRRAANEIG